MSEQHKHEWRSIEIDTGTITFSKEECEICGESRPAPAASEGGTGTKPKCNGCESNAKFDKGEAVLVRDCLARCSKCRAQIQSIDYVHTCLGGTLCAACYWRSPGHKVSNIPDSPICDKCGETITNEHEDFGEWKCLKCSGSPVASVEGQRTGEHVCTDKCDVDGHDSFNDRGGKSWSPKEANDGRETVQGNQQQTERDNGADGGVLDVDNIRDTRDFGESKVVTSSVPGVEGMGAREQEPPQLERIRDFISMVTEWTAKFPLKGEASKEDTDASLVIYGCCEGAGENLYELRQLWQAARSLRGATEQELSDQDRVIEDRNRDIIDLMACVWKPFYARPDSEGRCASCQHYAESYKEFLTIVPHSKHCKFRKLIESSNRGDGSLRGAGGEQEPDGRTMAGWMAGECLISTEAESLLSSITEKGSTESREQELADEVKQLRAWKESMMAVTPDMQEIGKLIGVKWGDSVYGKIIPWLRAAASREQTMREELELLKSLASSEAPCGHPQQYCFTGDGGKHIVCLMCEYEDREAMRECLGEAPSSQSAADPDKWMYDYQQWELRVDKLLNGGNDAGN